MAGLVPIGAKLRACAGLSAPSPRLPSGRLRPSEPVIGPAKGRTRWTGYGEGRGEGASPQGWTRGGGSASPRKLRLEERPLTRNLREERANSYLSPQAGSGKNARVLATLDIPS